MAIFKKLYVTVEAAFRRDGGRINILDGWRGAAIIFVLIGHFGGESLFGLGSFGVEMFFVLSGRLMAEILFVKKHPLPDFFLRRFARVFPGLLVFIVVAFIVTFLFHGKFNGSYFSPKETLLALSFLINYSDWFEVTPRVFAHIWSLSVEEHSYILLGISALFLRSRPRALISLLYIASAVGLVRGVLLSLNGGSVHSVYWRTDVRASSIFLSAALYLTHIRSSTRFLTLASRVFGFLSFPLLLTALVLVYVGPDWVFYLFAPIAISVSLRFVEYWPVHIRRMLCSSVFVFAGTISFSLYLWQQPLYIAQSRVSVFYLIPLLFGVALFSYLFIEKPAREVVIAFGRRNH